MLAAAGQQPMVKKLRALLHWLLGKEPAGIDPVILAVSRFRADDVDTLDLLRQLVATLRPRGRRDKAHGERFASLIKQLEANPALAADFRRHVVHFLATRRQLTFFTDSGILPGTGFFSEWWRILGNRLLPEAHDERRLKDCLHLIFDRPHDWRWLEELPTEDWRRLWDVLAPQGMLHDVDWRAIQEQMLDAVLLLAHRISGLGVESELTRVSPNFDDDRPCFIALSAETLAFTNAFRQGLDAPNHDFDDGSQLLVIAEQCRAALQRIRRRALSVGTSLHLSYLLTRGEQSLDRLGDLISILLASDNEAHRQDALPAWTAFASTAFLAENRRNSLRFYLAQLSGLLAVRVTENAARAGEHYICDTAADYRGMWKSATGAGVLIAGMALIKIKAAALHPPLFVEAFVNSMIYGLGFVLIYLLGLTVATKQPAMTAQTLASLLSDIKPNRSADLEKVVDVIAAVCRSQLAAICGNVLIALPVAIVLGIALSHWHGAPAISPDKAAQLLGNLAPLGWAIPHAAIAGFYLFLSGLISGYFDNHAAYAEIGTRIGRLRWLSSALGNERARRIGAYIQDRLGGIMGNLLFGCMLGSTAVIGTILGLPLDIRHIAFASANLGYALTGFQFQIAGQAILWAALGIAAIGLTNLIVSFALALRTALGARRIRFEHWGPLLAAIGRRLRREPRTFLAPQRLRTSAP